MADPTKAELQAAVDVWDAYVASIVEKITFSDLFDRADQNLEADGNWTRIGGSAGWGLVSSGAVRSNTTNTNGAAFLCPDLQTASHYVEAQFLSDNSPGFACARMSDVSNYIGLRYANGAIEVYKKIGGIFSFITSFTTPRGNALYRLEYDAAAGTVRVLKDGVQVIAPGPTGSLGSMPASTRGGLVVRSSAAPLLDRFTAGAM